MIKTRNKFQTRANVKNGNGFSAGADEKGEFVNFYNSKKRSL